VSREKGRVNVDTTERRQVQDLAGQELPVRDDRDRVGPRASQATEERLVAAQAFRLLDRDSLPMSDPGDRRGTRLPAPPDRSVRLRHDEGDLETRAEERLERGHRERRSSEEDDPHALRV